MATNRDASAAIAALKTTPRPGFIRFKEWDSETTAQVAVPNVKRWKGKVKKILEGLPWEWIEPLDPKGNIMGPRIDNESNQAAGELEDLESPSSPNGASELALLHGLTTLMLKAQDVALSRQAQAYSEVLKNNQALLKTVTDRASAMERHAMSSFEVITSLHNRLNLEIHENQGEDGPPDPLEKLVGEVVGEVVKAKMGVGKDSSHEGAESE